ncbi:MAG: AAA family ATPase [Oscillospiraceae bacterium]|jgi:chromosome partitioning protein|nr:AAA family ATPase [Oscillospiraceae bacterium]
MNAKIIALCNQKGGCAKTTTTISLGTGLARQGKKVLLIDFDPQANLTQGLGFVEPDEMEFTIGDIMLAVIGGKEPPYIHDCVLKAEGIDLIPSNLGLSTVETPLINALSRESKLKQFLSPLREMYDYILIDTMPSLGLLTINALVAADSVLIPVQAHFFSAKGLEMLINTVSMVRRELNPALEVEGVLITMIQENTNFGRDIADAVRNTYGAYFKIFKNQIPLTIKAAETNSRGMSLFAFDPGNRAAKAYEAIVKEVLRNAG